MRLWLAADPEAQLILLIVLMLVFIVWVFSQGNPETLGASSLFGR